jgi:competence protein ComEC
MLFVVFAPFVAIFTGGLAIAAIPANLLAVPLLSLVVVPLILLATPLLFVADVGWLSSLAFTVADFTIFVVERWLIDLDSVEVIHLIDRPLWVTGLLCSGGLLLLGQVSVRLGLFLAVAAMALWVPSNADVPHGSFTVTALDVGQGSAIFIETRRHRLLYDTGPRYSGGFDLGTAVVLPGLRSDGRGLDTLVLSHGDTDHTGGVATVLKAYPDVVRLSGEPTPGFSSCQGRSWIWDGVRFEVVYPEVGSVRDGNDASCVLLVTSLNETRLLLAGDISAAVEPLVSRRMGQGISLMFAPHHGSRTSSSVGFVKRLKPSLVFISAGHLSRYGHPHPDVVKRYADVGARVFRTAAGGALSWRSDRPHKVKQARSENWYPWMY